MKNITDDIMNESHIDSEERVKSDIFDKLVHLKPFRWFEDFFQAHREGLLYLFFGAATTVVNLALSAFFWYVLGWKSVYADMPWGRMAVGTFFGNLLSIVLSIVFAYVTNRVWVFRSQTCGMKAILTEFFKFAGGRVVTMIIELGGVQLGTVLFPGDDVKLFISKLIAQIIVILLNFVISKLFVFREVGKTDKN